MENNKDIEILDEGTIESTLITFIGSLAGAILCSVIIQKIINYSKNLQDHKNIKNLIKNNKELLINESDSLIKQYNYVLKHVKYIEYNPIVIPMMKDYLEFMEKAKKDLEKIDNEIESLETKEIFYKKKDNLKNKYNIYNKKCNVEINKLKNKYKNIKTEWISDDKIISELNKYIKCYFNFFRNPIDDDYDNIKIIYDYNYSVSNIKESEIDKIINDVNKLYNSVNGSIELIKKLLKNPFNYIKFHFTDNKPQNECIAELLIEAADLLTLNEKVL